MSTSIESSLPSDIRLLLRADAEQCWLHREVIPVLHEIESEEQLAEEEVGAALAYLEAMWDEATLRARETDAAHTHLNSRKQHDALLDTSPLVDPAGRYHAAVSRLRGIVAERVKPFVEQALEYDGRVGEACDSAEPFEDELRLKDARPGGCTPRVA
jgi:hypothetical protein